MRALWLATAISLAAVAGCRNAEPEEKSDAAPAVTPADVTFNAEQIEHGGVKWSAVATTPIADVTELPGRLIANEDHTARLSPAVRGRVIAVTANLGDKVDKGAVLLTLQSEEGAARRADLANAAAQLGEREAAMTFARSARERAERLLAMKAGSQQDVERARTDEATAQSALTQAQANVEHARTALSVLDVNSESGLIELSSPVSGVVIARDAVAGAVIEAGASALVVTDPSTLWLEFGAPDLIANALRPGQQVRGVVPVVGDVEARVLRISGAVDPGTRLVNVRAEVVNRSGKMRPEMFVTVRASASGTTPGIAVPDDAIQLLDEKPFVFLVEPDANGGARFIRRAVQTGASSGGRTHIIGGLTGGDVVVTTGAFAVKSAFARSKMPAGG